MPARKKTTHPSARSEAEASTPDTVKSDSAPAAAKPIRLTKEGKPFREQRRGKIRKLPDKVRGELDYKLGSNSFRSYRIVSQWLEDEHAARISPSALNYHKRHKLDLKLVPVKYATQEARAIVEASGGDNEEINRVLTTLVQTKLYEMLVQMNTVIEAFDQVESASQHSAKVLAARATKKNGNQAAGAESKIDQDERVSPQFPNRAALTAVTTMVKNTAAIGHHVIDSERWELDRALKLAEQIEAANQKVSQVASEAGLSPDVEKSIRAALMEIKV